MRLAPTEKCVASLVMFFFSSRRRHTTWTGDWSSDVCSSDLECRGQGLPGIPREELLSCLAERSEERRVGKEWGFRGGGYDGERKRRFVCGAQVVEGAGFWGGEGAVARGGGAVGVVEAAVVAG